MPVVEFYTRKNGNQPAAEWLASLDKDSRTTIRNKMEKLAEYGLHLVGTEMLKIISGDDRDLYELRGGQCRIATYYDRRRNTFILLHGWLKKKPKQRHDIEQSRHLLQEYLAAMEG